MSIYSMCSYLFHTYQLEGAYFINDSKCQVGPYVERSGLYRAGGRGRNVTLTQNANYEHMFKVWQRTVTEL